MHVRVSAPDGSVVFESGRSDAYGRLVGPKDVLAEPLSFAPHLDNLRNRWAVFTAPIGTGGDASFGSSDVVTYRVARVPLGATVAVRLLFQTARPSDLEALAAAPTPAARVLFDMTTAAPPLPSIVAETTTTST